MAFTDSSLAVDPKLPPPNEAQILALRKIVLGGLADHVARWGCSVDVTVSENDIIYLEMYNYYVAKNFKVCKQPNLVSHIIFRFEAISVKL